jgi:hypothetical protein
VEETIKGREREEEGNTQAREAKSSHSGEETCLGESSKLQEAEKKTGNLLVDLCVA